MTDPWVKLADVLFPIKCPVCNLYLLIWKFRASQQLWFQCVCVCLCERVNLILWHPVGGKHCFHQNSCTNQIIYFSGSLLWVEELLKKKKKNGQAVKNTTDRHHSKLLLKLPLIMDLEFFYSWMTVYPRSWIAGYRKQMGFIFSPLLSHILVQPQVLLHKWHPGENTT